MEQVSFTIKLLIAIFAGFFGLAIAVSVQQLRIYKIPKIVLIVSIIVQLTLSYGVFIFVMLLFNSQILPDSIPNDDYTALSVAYILSAVPNIVVASVTIIFYKEINAFLTKRYGENISVQNTNNETNNDKNELDSESQKDEEKEGEKSEKRSD